MIKYMEDYGLDMAQCRFLEIRFRFTDAARVHFTHGRVLEAIHLLTADTDNPISLRLAADYLLDGLWQNVSLGIKLNSGYMASESHVVLRQLLHLTRVLDLTCLPEKARDEVRRNSHSYVNKTQFNDPRDCHLPCDGTP